MGGASTTLALSEGLRIERAVFVSPPADPRAFLQIFGDALGITEAVHAKLKKRVERRVGRSIESMRADLIAPSMQAPLLVNKWWWW